jgi:hypothetical protein
LAAINSSRTTILPSSLNAERRIIEAKALVAVGRMEQALEVFRETPPDVFNHNLETAPRMYRVARPGADGADTCPQGTFERAERTGRVVADRIVDAFDAAIATSAIETTPALASRRMPTFLTPRTVPLALAFQVGMVCLLAQTMGFWQWA